MKANLDVNSYKKAMSISLSDTDWIGFRAFTLS